MPNQDTMISTPSSADKGKGRLKLRINIRDDAFCYIFGAIDGREIN